jgi:hypothetical protein
MDSCELVGGGSDVPMVVGLAAWGSCFLQGHGGIISRCKCLVVEFESGRGVGPCSLPLTTRGGPAYVGLGRMWEVLGVGWLPASRAIPGVTGWEELLLADVRVPVVCFKKHPL